MNSCLQLSSAVLFLKKIMGKKLLIAEKGFTKTFLPAPISLLPI
jgi:hypothetical protein